MEVIRGLHNLQPRHRGCVLAIGNFDGVHLGHRMLLQRLREQGQKLGLPGTLIIFEPQPLEYFLDADSAPPRLTKLRDKLQLLHQGGLIDRVLCLPFNDVLATRSAEFIVEHLLVEKLDIRYILVGDDFRFGAGRTGDFAMLKQAGNKHNFKAERLETVIAHKDRLSSSLIRQLLIAGDIAQAEKLLGHAYFITGHVAYGRKLARTIGMPTANIRLGSFRPPVEGVFAVSTSFQNHRIPGIANLGIRPTVSGVDRLLEVHLLDFNAPLYGRLLKVRFLRKIREERTFENFEMLAAQMKKDLEIASQWLQEGDLRELYQEAF